MKADSSSSVFSSTSCVKARMPMRTCTRGGGGAGDGRADDARGAAAPAPCASAVALGAGASAAALGAGASAAALGAGRDSGVATKPGRRHTICRMLLLPAVVPWACQRWKRRAASATHSLPM